MDRIDREILLHLQEDGRASLTDLAKTLRISLSSCHRRVRALETSGVISGYRAQVDSSAIGFAFNALVFITMRSTARAAVEAFESTVITIPQVIETQRLFGEPDYLLRVVATDLTGFQELYDQQLSQLPGVQRLTSTLVMKSITPTQSLPL
jgi:DNA-binding Lrp family transcriptional regulator